jgi:hypothetical protein
MKIPWWRAIRGHLTVRGKRLDAPHEHLEAKIPQGYGETGFQPSLLKFSSEGCWEITGSVGEAALTFVAKVQIPKTE